MKRDIWIAEIAEQSPCGDDLEYDPEFLALSHALEGKPEQQYGATIIAAQEPDWLEVERLAAALMSRAKDVRVCTVLARACTNNHGLKGLAAVLQTLQTLLEKYWDAVHPRVTNDGEADPFVRVGAIAAVADRAGLLGDVRNAVLMRSTAGPVLVKDAEAAFVGNKPSGSGFSREQLLAMAADASTDRQDLAALSEAALAATAIAQLCEERLGAQHAPDISPLSGLLSTLATSFAPVSHADAVDPGADDASVLDTGNAPPDRRYRSQVPGAREDAIEMLEAVCAYLEQYEPTSPAPLLIKRAQRLMSLNFIDIIKDLTPDSLGQIELIAGTRRE